jgi:hypothetical protein
MRAGPSKLCSMNEKNPSNSAANSDAERPRLPSGYDILADEYYSPRHITSRNFDVATHAYLRSNPVAIPNYGLALDLGAGRGRLSEYCGVHSTRIVQTDLSVKMDVKPGDRRDVLKVSKPNPEPHSEQLLVLLNITCSGISSLWIYSHEGWDFFAPAELDTRFFRGYENSVNQNLSDCPSPDSFAITLWAL